MNFVIRYPAWALLFFTLITLLPNLGVLDVSIMEARDYVTAREMVKDGHWLLTTLNGIPRYEKPPLPTWLSAVSGWIFGFSSFAMRLPSVLMIWLCGYILMKICKLLGIPRYQQIIAGFVGASSFYVVAIIFEAPWDIFAHGFCLTSIFFLLRLFKESRHVNLNGILSGLFLALAFLSKGPIPIYALFLPFLLAFGICFGYKNIRNKISALILLLFIFCVSGLWWYIYVRWADPQTWEAIASKETANWAIYNVKPFYYYWSFFVQSGMWTIPALMGLLYTYLNKKLGKDFLNYKFFFIWTIAAVVLLSLIPEKKSRYLMPVLLPLAGVISFYIEYARTNFKIMKLIEKLPMYTHFGILSLVGLGFSFLPLVINEVGHSPWLFIPTAAILFFIGSGFLLTIMKRNIDLGLKLQLLLWMVLGWFVLPMSTYLGTNTFYSSPKSYFNNNSPQNLKNFSFTEPSPELLWEYGDKILAMNESDLEDQFGLFIYPEDISKFQKFYKDTFEWQDIATFDLNRVQPESRDYKPRLRMSYFIVQKR